MTSFDTGEKIYCVHEADDADTIREHARCGGFPANNVVEIAATVGPDTALVSAPPHRRSSVG